MIPAQVLELHSQNLTAAEIARRLNVTWRKVQWFLHSRGLPIHNHRYKYGEPIKFEGRLFFRTKTGAYKDYKDEYLHRVIWEKHNGYLRPSERLIFDKNEPMNIERIRKYDYKRAR